MNRDVDLQHVRRDYQTAQLEETSIPDNPLVLVKQWVDDALAASISDGNAMALATVDREGYPTSRIVLLRDISESGLVFYTNYRSAKAHELASLPKASLNFFWSALERQIRVKGQISLLPAEDSDRYFASRPRDSQIGAWASPQSQIIADRSELEDLVQRKSEEFRTLQKIPRPDFWGGYRLDPVSIEFWQGRPNRLHDRLRALRTNGLWNWERLAP